MTCELPLDVVMLTAKCTGAHILLTHKAAEGQNRIYVCHSRHTSIKERQDGKTLFLS